MRGSHVIYTNPRTPPPAPLFLPPGNSHWDVGYLEKKNSERITLSFIHKPSRDIRANFLLYCDGSDIEEPKDFKEFWLIQLYMYDLPASNSFKIFC